MKTTAILAVACAWTTLCGPVWSAVVSIEPDDFAESTTLNDINPLVQLRIYDGVLRTNFPVDFGVFPTPSVIPVTANEKIDIFGGYHTSTGTKTFGHFGITFFPESRQLAMRFPSLASQVELDFVGTNTIAGQIGVLEIFNASGVMLDSMTSSSLLAHQIATLRLSRSPGDIGYARAYFSPSANPFGTLDNLRFTTLPEPPASILLFAGAGILARFFHRSRRR